MKSVPTLWYTHVCCVLRDRRRAAAIIRFVHAETESQARAFAGEIPGFPHEIRLPSTIQIQPQYCVVVVEIEFISLELG